MWFEVLPSVGVITVCMAIPGYALYGLHKLTLGNAYRRSTEDLWNRRMYLRDRRMDPNGNAYKVHGLEAIPDN